jgi:hypothetical protein
MSVLHYYGAPCGGLQMATVTCDICGGIFSQRYLPSHKRLAHSQRGYSASAPMSEKEAIQKISSLYGNLSNKGRRRVVRLLAAKDKDLEKGQKIQ